MDSIYGGRPGSPFVIKARFRSVEEMQKAFKNGPEYKAVWYGEYCIIDTDNKNDFDNGKIYQRGTEYGNGTGDAKYVGQVVGPQSGVPGFDFDPLNDVKGYNTKPFPEKDDGEIRTWPYQSGDDDNSSKKFYQDYKGKTDESKPNLFIQEFSVNNNSLVKGWDGGNNFVDSIKYTWVNIAYPYGDEKSTRTLMGFQIPYPVFDVSVNPISSESTASVTEDSKTEKHPFAYKWVFNIPRGAKGDSVSLSFKSFSEDNPDGTKVVCTSKETDDTTNPPTTTTKEEHFDVNEIADLYSDIGEGCSNHLYALYSSREARKNDALKADGFTRGSQIGIPKDNYKSNLNWKDLGAIKDQSGILVGRDLNKEDIEDTDKKPASSASVVLWLNTNYKNKKQIDGKVCTFRNKDGETWFFAWDYNETVPETEPTTNVNGWYYVGTFGGGGTKFSVSDGGDNAPKGWYFKKAEKVAFTTKKNWWDMP